MPTSKDVKTCGTSVSDGFYWNPDFSAKLTDRDRKIIATHERLHIQYYNGMDPEVRRKSLEDIEKFEKGEV